MKDKIDSPLVSIIIPVFNVKYYLTETLESVINQTYKNLDIILIDDGSTDGSSDICDEYASKDKRIRVHHQVNQGVSAVRNAGLDLAVGEFLAFLDSDDAYYPDYLSSMMTTMIHEGVDIVMCKYTEHKTRGKMVLTGHEKIFPLIVGGGTRNC